MELSGDSSCSNKGECYLTTIPKGQREKEEENSWWTDKLDSLQDSLEQKRLERLRVKREIDDLISDKNQCVTEVGILKESIGKLKREIETNHELIRNEEVNYRNRLGYIPLNALLFAHLPFDSPVELNQQRRAVAAETLRRSAFKHIHGTQLVNLEIYHQDEELRKFVADINQGHATVTDSYQCEKPVPLKVRPDYYLIQRIEVLPFRQNEGGELGQSELGALHELNDQMGSFNVYQLDWDQKRLSPIDDRTSEDKWIQIKQLGLNQSDPSFVSSYAQHTRAQLNLNPSEFSFIASHAQHTKAMNQLANEKLNQIYAKYLGKKSEFQNEIEDYQRKLNTAEGDLSRKELQAGHLELEVEDARGQLAEADENFRTTWNRFEEHYSTRMSVVSKSEQTFGSMTENQSPWMFMIRQSGAVVDELSQQSQRYVDLYSSELNETVQMAMRRITHSPVAVGFRVLYLGTMGFDRPVYFLNIAYRIHWQSGPPPPNPRLEVNGSGEFCEYIGTECRNCWYLVAVRNPVLGVMYELEMASLENPIVTHLKETGFSIPTMEDLIKFIRLRRQWRNVRSHDVFAVMADSSSQPLSVGFPHRPFLSSDLDPAESDVWLGSNFGTANTAKIWPTSGFHLLLINRHQ